MPTHAMLTDWACPHCGARFGKSHTPGADVQCPRCRMFLDYGSLEKDEAALAEFRKFLMARKVRREATRGKGKDG